jgi:hypothetical protein
VPVVRCPEPMARKRLLFDSYGFQHILRKTPKLSVVMQPFISNV